MKERKKVSAMEYINKAEKIILANPRILEDESYPDVRKVYREHYRNKRVKYSTNNDMGLVDNNVVQKKCKTMKVEEFYSFYNLFDDIQSILLDLIYDDQICGPSNEYEEQEMERSAKYAIYTLLNSSYADRNGEIDASNIDFDDLYDSMHNTLFKEFNHFCNNDDDYEDLYY